jgi:NAD(P)H-nitrite reductase large subunit
VTNSDQHRKIADVADKYQIPMIKLTGGQRIDLLGVLSRYVSTRGDVPATTHRHVEEHLARLAAGIG